MTKNEGFWNSTKEVAGNTWEKTKDVSGHIWEKTKETAEDVKDYIVGDEENALHSEHEHNHPNSTRKNCSCKKNN